MEGFFNIDAYKMMTNLPITVYNTKINNDIISADFNFPYSMNNLLYNFFLFLTFSIFLCGVHQPVLSSFFLPTFIILAFGFWFHIKERSELVRIESEYKVQENYLSKGILDGVDRIRGLKIQTYFKRKMNEILQNQILVDLYMSGRSHSLNLRAYMLVFFMAVLPTFVYMMFSYKRDYAFPCNIIVIAFTPILPKVLSATFEGLDKIKTNMCQINDSVNISKFGQCSDDKKEKKQKLESSNLCLKEEKTTENLVNIDESFTSGGITIENLNIFKNSKTVLIKSFSTKIKPGEHIAFISDSDTPISSIFDIFMMFLKTYSGDIIIDNKFLEAISVESVRKQIHLSDLNHSILKGILKDNISALRGKKIVKESESYSLVNFLKKYRFTEKDFENYGYSTKIHPKKISKRNKILLNFANIFMTKKKIMLIDRIDWEFNDDLFKIFEEIKMNLKEKKTTVLMVCSRMETAMLFDRVIVFEKGEVVEQGHPDVLYGIEKSRVRVKFDKEIEMSANGGSSMKNSLKI